MSFFIGTSGYAYADWKGVFYPEGTRPKDYLSFYNKRFRFVELNFSYYKMPSSTALSKLASIVTSPFQFSIKMHQSLTHTPITQAQQATQVELAQLCDEFARACASLGTFTVLAQFPWSFHYRTEQRKYLDALHKQFLLSFSRFQPLEGILGSEQKRTPSIPPLCFEFRNPEWLQPRVLGQLEERGIIPVLYDCPDIKDLSGALAKHPWLEHLQSKQVYIRMHGRNQNDWWQGDSRSRYDYEYSFAELAETAQILQTLDQSASDRIIYLAFNNHASGKAVRNAQTIAGLINPSHNEKSESQ